MSKRGILPAVALLIYLVITLPLCSSIGWANVQSTAIYGNDKVSGFRKENDDTYISVNVSPASGDHTLYSTQLTILEDMSMGFVCELINNVSRLQKSVH